MQVLLVPSLNVVPACPLSSRLVAVRCAYLSPHLSLSSHVRLLRLREVELGDARAHLRSRVTVRVKALLVKLCFWLEWNHPICCFLCFRIMPSGGVLWIWLAQVCERWSWLAPSASEICAQLENQIDYSGLPLFRKSFD